VAPLLLAVDFDGTITSRDTLHVIVEAFGGRGVWDELEPSLQAGEITIEDAMRTQFAAVRATTEEALAAVRRDAPIRDGFRRFVAWAEQAGHRMVILSAGFRVVIDAVLADADIANLEIHSNDIAFSREGARLIWAERGGTCGHCGRRCKRHQLALRREPDDHVVYVGDGISDRCVSAQADTVFARSSLAEYLADQGRSYVPFDDFDEIVHHLENHHLRAA
jgi:2-hydroxy-3-keto-5-methylthiopentenyl-1-phosphate phosphatase